MHSSAGSEAVYALHAHINIHFALQRVCAGIADIDGSPAPEELGCLMASAPQTNRPVGGMAREPVDLSMFKCLQLMRIHMAHAF